MKKVSDVHTISQNITIIYGSYRESFEVLDLFKQKINFDDIQEVYKVYKKEVKVEDKIDHNKIEYSNNIPEYYKFKFGDYDKIQIGNSLSVPDINYATINFHNTKVIDGDLVMNFNFLNSIKSIKAAYINYLLMDSRYATPSDDFIEKEGKRATFNQFGFNIYWTFVVDYITIGKIKIPKEVILKAPAFMVKELDSSSVYVRLTEEEPDPYNFIVEYVDAYMEFYDYCMNWIKVNTK